MTTLLVGELSPLDPLCVEFAPGGLKEEKAFVRLYAAHWLVLAYGREFLFVQEGRVAKQRGEGGGLAACWGF